MATTYTIYANTDDGYVRRLSDATDNWGPLRGTGSGATVTSSYTINAYDRACECTHENVRGVDTCAITRSFLSFTVDAIRTIPHEAKLYLYKYGVANSDFRVVKSSYSGNVSSADFNEIDGLITSGADGSGGADSTSSVTSYSGTITSMSTGSYQTIPLNGAALADMPSNRYLNMAIVDWTYDMADNQPSTDLVGQSNYTGFYYRNNLSPTVRPKLIVVGQDDALFLGTNF